MKERDAICYFGMSYGRWESFVVNIGLRYSNSVFVNTKDGAERLNIEDRCVAIYNKESHIMVLRCFEFKPGDAYEIGSELVDSGAERLVSGLKGNSVEEIYEVSSKLKGYAVYSLRFVYGSSVDNALSGISKEVKESYTVCIISGKKFVQKGMLLLFNNKEVLKDFIGTYDLLDWEGSVEKLTKDSVYVRIEDLLAYKEGKVLW